MRKQVLFLVSILALLTLNGCASFNETYKPLYQVKPEVKSIKGQ